MALSGGEQCEVSVEEILFACEICQATISDIYTENDSDHGFRSDTGNQPVPITKLWILDCTHVVCGKHLENGAPPFHPQGTLPQACCPVCAEQGNHSQRNLFGIRGVAPGQYDDNIPSEWLTSPPILLEGAEMEAMRFQYSRLLRFSRQAAKHWKAAESKSRTLEDALSKERKQIQKLETEHQQLKGLHEEVAVKLQKWENRKEQIRHYMGAVTEMSNDLRAMRSKLIDLGFSVPHKRYGMEQPESKAPLHPTAEVQGRSGDSSATLVNEQHRSSSSRKRKLAEYDAYADGREIQPHMQPAPADGRALRPPAPPRARRKPRDQQPLLSASRSQQQSTHPQVQTFESGHWYGDHEHGLYEEPPQHQAPGSKASRLDQDPLSNRLSQMDLARARGGPMEVVPSQLGEDYNVGDAHAMDRRQLQQNGLLSQPPKRPNRQHRELSGNGDMFINLPANGARQRVPSRMSALEPPYEPAMPPNDARTIRTRADPQGRTAEYSRVPQLREPPTNMPHPPQRNRAEVLATSNASPFFHRSDAIQSRTQPQQSSIRVPPVRQPVPFSRNGNQGYAIPHARSSAAPSSVIRPSHEYLKDSSYKSAPPGFSYMHTFNRSPSQVQSVEPSYNARGNDGLQSVLSRRPAAPTSMHRSEAFGGDVQQATREPRHRSRLDDLRAASRAAVAHSGPLPRHSLGSEMAQIGTRRPAPPPSAAGSYVSTRSILPPAQPYRSRITLPPTSSYGSQYKGAQDPQLSMIRGVRGAGTTVPRPLYSSRGTAASQYPRQRPLQSPAGHGRMVQR